MEKINTKKTEDEYNEMVKAAVNFATIGDRLGAQIVVQEILKKHPERHLNSKDIQNQNKQVGGGQ